MTIDIYSQRILDEHRLANPDPRSADANGQLAGEDLGDVQVADPHTKARLTCVFTGKKSRNSS